MTHVAELVADNGGQLFVVHHVHKAGINTDGAVAARECIDLVGAVHLEVQRQAVQVSQSGEHPPETLGIGAVVDDVLLVELEDSLAAQRHYLLVRDVCGCNRLPRRAGEAFGIPVDARKNRAAAQRKERCGIDDQFLHIVDFISSIIARATAREAPLPPRDSRISA